MSLATPLGKDVLLIQSLRVHEGLSELFRYEIDIVNEEEAESQSPTRVDPRRVLGQPMTVTLFQDIARDDLTPATEIIRHFHGLCVSFSQGNRDGRYTFYHAELAPAAWLLTQTTRSRIFQQKSVPQILKKVFEGLKFKFEIQGNFEPRNYCVQYNESDWNFASRLMEEEGIYYFFEHNAAEHTMVVANTPQSHPDCPKKSKFPFVTDTSSLSDHTGSVTAWRVDNYFRTGKYTVRDHHFELPANTLEAEQVSLYDLGGNQQLEFYDYPGGFAKRFDGVDSGGGDQSGNLTKVFEDRQRTLLIRQQELDSRYTSAYAESDSVTLTAGHKFTLDTHPEPSQNVGHIILSVDAAAVQIPSYGTDEIVANPYAARFVCLPKIQKAAPFRPPRKTPKPVIHGSQTAVVVGTAGEEIFTDKYGRVKVQFHWDREGKKDSDSSCWIRVATPWAGSQWGGIHIPRVGMEVVVNFLDGDPDRPIIVGAVYNPNTMPPYDLPDEKTKSTIKSSVSKGGAGFNEIRFEDKKAAEQIYVHAERDFDTHILRDCKEQIGRDRHLTIDGGQFESINRDQNIKVGGNHNEQIDGAASLKVGTSVDVKAGTKLAGDAGTEIHLKAGMTTVIEAGTSLTLKVGGNFININPGGIFIKGAMVMINSGGAAGSGSGASPDSPIAPTLVEKVKSGQKIEVKTAAPPPPPVPPKVAELAAVVRSAPAGAAPGGVEAAVREAVNASPEIESPISSPVADAVEEARETIAQYSDPDEPAANAEPQSVSQNAANAPAAPPQNDAGAAADEASARIARAAAEYRGVPQNIEEAKKLVAAYETVFEGVGKQSMSLINAADNASPFSAR